MNIKVLGNRVLIHTDKVETHTDGGVAIPRVAQKRPEAGTVLRVGPGEVFSNGRTKTAGVFRGDHVLYTDSGYEPVMLDDQECAFVEGDHVFARSTTDFPLFIYNETTIGFDHVALRDVVFVLPSLPPKTLGSKGSILIPEAARKGHHDKTGLVLSAGPGYLSKVDYKYHETDPALTAGAIVKYDLSVPWNTWVYDTKGKRHFVSICGIMDIYGVVGRISRVN